MSTSNLNYPRHLGETQDIKYTDPVIIRTLLGDSSGCMQHKMNADPHDNSMSLSSNDASQCDKGLIDIRLKHIKKRVIQLIYESVPINYCVGSKFVE